MENGLCLAGGGVKGAAHIGVIKALEEENIDFKYIGGTSSGSIVACLYSCGFTSDEIYKIFKKYCKKIRYVDFLNVIKLIVGLIFTGNIIIDGLNSGKEIEKLIKKVCNKRGIFNIQDARKTIAIPSVNLCNGKVICFTSECNKKIDLDNTVFVNDIEIGKAVRASCSYPVVFSPCKYKDIKLIDGGIRENVPWKELKRLGARKVLNITFEEETTNECDKNIIDVASSSIGLLSKELSSYELEGSDYTIKIRTNKIGLLDMKQIDKMYEEGYNETKRNIKEIKEKILSDNGKY